VHLLKPVDLARGLDQGCPLSGVAFQYYNTDLLNVPDPRNGEDVVALMDDTLMLIHSKSLEEVNAKLQAMMEKQGGGLNWLCIHQCKFAIDKFGIMGFSRRRELNLLKKLLTIPACRCQIFLQGIKIPVVTVHKFPGILLDQEL